MIPPQWNTELGRGITSVAEWSHFDTVPTSYFLHTVPVPCIILRKFKNKAFFSYFLLKLLGNWMVLTWNCLFCYFSPIPFKTCLSNPYLRPFYTRNWNQIQNRSLEQDHGSDSSSDNNKTIWFWRFRFQLRLPGSSTLGDNCNDGEGMLPNLWNTWVGVAHSEIPSLGGGEGGVTHQCDD
jgi:hypothetical protein